MNATEKKILSDEQVGTTTQEEETLVVDVGDGLVVSASEDSWEARRHLADLMTESMMSRCLETYVTGCSTGNNLNRKQSLKMLIKKVTVKQLNTHLEGELQSLVQSTEPLSTRAKGVLRRLATVLGKQDVLTKEGMNSSSTPSKSNKKKRRRSSKSYTSEDEDEELEEEEEVEAYQDTGCSFSSGDQVTWRDAQNDLRFGVVVDVISKKRVGVRFVRDVGFKQMSSSSSALLTYMPMWESLGSRVERTENELRKIEKGMFFTRVFDSE